MRWKGAKLISRFGYTGANALFAYACLFALMHLQPIIPHRLLRPKVLHAWTRAA
jgi:hypothetical protein